MRRSFLPFLKNLILMNREIIELACKHRAKFEEWVKFQLAHELQSKIKNSNISIERKYIYKNRRYHVDIVIETNGRKINVEIKTVNTNFKIGNIESKSRPISENIKSIIRDIEKLEKLGVRGKILFVIFPIPLDIRKDKYKNYLERIKRETNNKHIIKAEFLKLTINYGIAICEIEVVN